MRVSQLIVTAATGALAAALAFGAVPASARPEDGDGDNGRGQRVERSQGNAGGWQARQQAQQAAPQVQQQAAPQVQRQEWAGRQASAQQAQQAQQWQGRQQRDDSQRQQWQAQRQAQQAQIQQRDDSQRQQWQAQRQAQQQAQIQQQQAQAQQQLAQRQQAQQRQQGDRQQWQGRQQGDRQQWQGRRDTQQAQLPQGVQPWEAQQLRQQQQEARNWNDQRNGTYTDRNRSGTYTDRNRTQDRSRYQDGRRFDGNTSYAYRNGDRNYQRWDRNWRNNNRYDWQRYRQTNRFVFNLGSYYSPYYNYSYRRLSIGSILAELFYGQNYWISDPWQYRLPEVYGPYRWVRYYDDALLVDIYSGEVVDVIYDFFW